MAGLLAGLATGAVLAASTPPDPAVDLAHLVESAGGMWEGGVPESVAEMLPNAKLAGEPTWSWSDTVVVGTVVSVVPEAGYVELPTRVIPGTNVAITGARVSGFDDPKAVWRSLRVTLRVEETIAGAPAATLDLSWSLLGNGRLREDHRALARAFRALGRIVVLARTDRSPDPDSRDVRRVVAQPQRGILLVDRDGALEPPFADMPSYVGSGCCAFDPTAFLAGVDTLDELRAQAAKPEYPFARR